MFAIITRETQKIFETECNGITPSDLPMICGRCGRACRQMGKDEGANRNLCIDCPLARFSKQQRKSA